jgi:phosphate transport system substrate-binding protein
MLVRTIAAGALTALVATAGAAQARDQIQIAGSSTVLPFANIVAEQFGKTFAGKFKTPIVESGGSSAGL